CCEAHILQQHTHCMAPIYCRSSRLPRAPLPSAGSVHPTGLPDCGPTHVEAQRTNPRNWPGTEVEIPHESKQKAELHAGAIVEIGWRFDQARAAGDSIPGCGPVLRACG